MQIVNSGSHSASRKSGLISTVRHSPLLNSYLLIAPTMALLAFTLAAPLALLVVYSF